jgi:hypothetical protein
MISCGVGLRECSPALRRQLDDDGAREDERVSGYLPAIGAKEIDPLEVVDRAVQVAVETREGPDELRRKIWRDESGAEIWVHLTGDAPHTTTVVFRGSGRVKGFLAGFSPPVDGPLNGMVMIATPEPALAPRLVLDLAEFGDAAPQFCNGRQVSVGVAGLLTEGGVFPDRASYLAACTRRGGEVSTVALQPIGMQSQGNTPSATLGGTISDVEERRNSLTGETFLVLDVEWEDQSLEVAAHPADLPGGPPAPGSYLSGKVWLVGFDLQYATAVPADPNEFPLRPGAVAAFAGYNGYLQLLQVTRLDHVEPGGLIVHMRIFAELFDSMESLQAHQGPREEAVPHLPIDAGAVLDSEIAVLGDGPLVQVNDAAYDAWRQAFERGEAGVFGIPLDQVIQFMANAQADQQDAEEAPTTAD